jgi:hypothetical protein
MQANKIVDKLLEQQEHTITVGEIMQALPPGTDKQIMDTLNSGLDNIALARKLKAILAPHAAALEDIGLLPDYTAYVLIWAGQKVREQQQQGN